MNADRWDIALTKEKLAWERESNMRSFEWRTVITGGDISGKRDINRKLGA